MMGVGRARAGKAGKGGRVGQDGKAGMAGKGGRVGEDGKAGMTGQQAEAGDGGRLRKAAGGGGNLSQYVASRSRPVCTSERRCDEGCLLLAFSFDFAFCSAWGYMMS